MFTKKAQIRDNGFILLLHLGSHWSMKLSQVIGHQLSNRIRNLDLEYVSYLTWRDKQVNKAWWTQKEYVQKDMSAIAYYHSTTRFTFLKTAIWGFNYKLILIPYGLQSSSVLPSGVTWQQLGAAQWTSSKAPTTLCSSITYYSMLWSLYSIVYCDNDLYILYRYILKLF